MPRIGTVPLGQISGQIGPLLERSRTSERFIAGTGDVLRVMWNCRGDGTCADPGTHQAGTEPTSEPMATTAA